MELPFWLLPLLGGGLIGLSSLGLVWGNGTIAGISGILGGALAPTSDAHEGGADSWRYSFLAGLLGGGFLLLWLYPSAFAVSFSSSYWLYGGMGIVVGFGTRLGNGCTSGHGVCGVSRLSQRSLVATGTFMLTGMITVYVTRHLLGGAV